MQLISCYDELEFTTARKHIGRVSQTCVHFCLVAIYLFSTSLAYLTHVLTVQSNNTHSPLD